MQRFLISINRLYESLEYERALKQIDLARQGLRSPEDEVTLSLYEGIILYELDKKDDAGAAFKSALLLKPDAKLPVKVAPKVERFFGSVQTQVQRELASMSPQKQTDNKLTEASPPPLAQTKQSLSTAATPSVTGTSVPRSALLHPRVLVPGIAGGALLVAGGTFWGLARAEYTGLQRGDPDLATLRDIEQSASRGRKYQTVGFSLMGVGLASLGAAAGMYVMGKSNSPVSLGISSNGSSGFVYGRWP